MKIALASDVHLEFGPLVLNNDQSADVLVLAGDVCVANDFVSQDRRKRGKAQDYLSFFNQVCRAFPQVVYVPGNHEHYHGDATKSVAILREQLDHANLHILDRETWQYQDVSFIGGTLWTDMNRRDPLTLMRARTAMNDFCEIKNSNRIIARKVPIYEPNPLWTDDGKNGSRYVTNEAGQMIQIGYKHKEEPSQWTPKDTVEEHQQMLDYIKTVTQESGRYVVVGHHAPSSRSVADQYQADTVMNGAFRSELDEFIENRPQILLWIHGHMHNASDYMIGQTRVVCNPRGYIGHENVAATFELKYLEV
jgi:Icc-related predicted phosphoesterase